MTSKASSAAKPSYTFRAFWGLLLLAGNLLVAAFYFGILK